MNTLSRNTPVALIVGAAGFVGSHLVDKLLEKGIQVIGMDNLSSGRRENLDEASKNKNFHFLNQDAAGGIHLDFPRLDYAFFIISENIPEYIYRPAFNNFLKVCTNEGNGPKIILVSSVDLYDSHKEGLDNLKYAEKTLANFALDNKANARVVRLTSIFGPRMHFRGMDPIFRLIWASALNKLQNETSPLDFTTRSLFIDDAIELLVKAFMHSATAQKIYDGALYHPVKISEIKEVLLDPIWYESKGFIPTQLPPWPTPNLLKTEKELAWKPEVRVVTALKLTLQFFRENQDLINKDIIEKPQVTFVEKKLGWEKREDIKEETKAKDPKKDVEIGKKRESKKTRVSLGNIVGIPLVIMLIAYALIYPLLKLTWTTLEIKGHIENSALAVEVGDFQRAEDQSNKAQLKVEGIKKILEPVAQVTEAGVFGGGMQLGKQLLGITAETVEAISFWVKGIKSLEESTLLISGAKEGDLEKVLFAANFNLNHADKKFQIIGNSLSQKELINSIPEQLKSRVEDLKIKVNGYQQGVKESKKAAMALSQIIPFKGSRSFLLLFIDNNTLRPGSGQIKSFAEVNFKDGKIISINFGSIGDLNKDLVENINFPADFKQDLSGKKLSLQDLNFESDFSTNGKLIQWVYSQSKGVRAAGVIALDIQAVSKILEASDGVLIGEKKEKITGKNFEELVFSKKDEKFEAEVFKEMLNKVFFLTNQNWTKIGRSLGQSLSEKHILVFASDPTLFSYLNSSGWTGTMPRQVVDEKGEKRQFLAFSETNIGTEGTSLYIKRVFDLKSTIDQNNRVSHKLTVSFSNQNQALDYQNRFKVYLPTGSRLTKALWGEKNILKEVTSFSDYGRSGYSMLLSLKAKEAKNLILEYEDLKGLDLKEGTVRYVLDLVKQPGMGEDEFNFNLRFPSTFKVTSKEGEQDVPQEISFFGDLSKDSSLEIILTKDPKTF